MTTDYKPHIHTVGVIVKIFKKQEFKCLWVNYYDLSATKFDCYRPNRSLKLTKSAPNGTLSCIAAPYITFEKGFIP